MECLDEETILAFCRGDLAPDARSAAEEHIGTCDECRTLVSAVMRSSFSELKPAPVHADAHAAAEADDQARARAEVDAKARTALDTDVRLRDYADRAEGAPWALLREREPGNANARLGIAATTPVGLPHGHGHGGSRPPVSPVQPGQILAGKFEVERVLGAGGMGIVVAARHTQLDQRVALKFLLPVACEVPGAVARFLREGRAAARITSEHVARVKDTGVLEGGAPYLVMEYLEGSDLGALVQQRGRIAVGDAVEYVLQACEAIVEAHELGIIHRDLKPANLFLSRRADGSPLVKVLDFGISKIEGGSRSELLTSASVLMGSPRYMSPEQMLSAKDVDVRTDVWALGVILYELVTGQPVWNADTVQGMCALIASSPAPPVRALAPWAPPALEDVIARCLAKSRDARIASVADLALALEPIAPSTARTSIGRILRVARKDRSPSAPPRSTTPLSVPPALAGPGGAAGSVPPRSVPPASGPTRGVNAPALHAAQARAGVTTEGTRRGGTPPVALLLGVGVGTLLLAGIALNATVLRRGGSSEASSSVVASSVASATASTAASAVSAAAVTPPSPSSTTVLLPLTTPVVSASAAVSAAPPGPGGGAPAGRRRPTAVAAAPSATAPPSMASAGATEPAPPAAKAPTAPVPSNRALTDRK